MGGITHSSEECALCRNPIRPIKYCVSFLVMGKSCLRLCIALERHYNHSDSYKGKQLTAVAHLQFRNSVMAREHGNWDYSGVQSNMVLERYLRILCHARDTLEPCWSIYKTLKFTSTVTHFLQQGHTYSNNGIHANKATPFGDHFHSNHHRYTSRRRQL